MKNKNIFWAVVIAAIIIGLFSLSSFLSPNKENIAKWNAAGIACLVNGHTNLAQHIHQHLEVTVNGSDVHIPDNIGNVSDCLAEVHTHEGEGAQIHVETLEPDKKILLKDFFTVWGEPYDRSGFARTVVVNNATSTDDEHLALEDKQDIHVIYVGLSK